MGYVVYDYEEPYPQPDKRNFWHIYSTDAEDPDIAELPATVLYIYGPATAELENKVAAICDAINAAITLAAQDK